MSYLRPLLPFSSKPSSSESSSSSSAPYTSLYPSTPSSSSTVTNSRYPDAPPRTRRLESFSLLPPLPTKKLWLPLLLLGCASYAFISSNFEGIVPQTKTRVLDDGGRTEAGSWSFGGGGGKEFVYYSEEEMKERWEKATKPLPFETTTLERLEEWENTLREVEAGEWVEKNLETCPDYRIRPNQNGQLADKSHLVWASMSSKKIVGIRKELADHLRTKIKEGALENYGEGKGLVFTAGNVDTFSRVLTTLRILHNHLHSPLPSEIFSFPGETPTPEIRTELERYNATLRTVSTASRDASRTKNYHLKANAIVQSRFREVLYLDSDNIPTAGLAPLDWPIPESVIELARKENRTERPWNGKNGDGGGEVEVWGSPSGIWESKAYKRLGVMFWSDYWRTSGDNAIWAIVGVPCRDEWEQEAGQILIDKKYHLDALLLAEWMMDSSRFKYWFNFSDGDKDMFRFAFLALRKRWGVPGRYVSVGALPSNTMSGFCGHTMLQNDHFGKPLFVHANLLKQIPSGVYKGFAWGRSRQIRTQASTLRIPTRFESSSELEREDPLVDDDIDCDMLANVQDDGTALVTASNYRVRRRGVIEKGIRAGFHGGMWSALCIDYRYEDPRTDDQRQEAKLSVARHLENPLNQTIEELAKEVDVCYCAANDGFETRMCGEEVTEIVKWKDDPRLRGFEDAFFQEGGHLNAKGF
ncbi:uncharacterized protein JCM6883_006119 [Sporobolomyces salmoneus]|uniref:uncharacterized protein n=1 Tax=Sporobolomyces salmoneus TaxID=183962 RepID=UPI00317EF00F